MYLEYTWNILGIYLECIWNVFGMYLECIWNVFGMYLECNWNILGMSYEPYGGQQQTKPSMNTYDAYGTKGSPFEFKLLMQVRLRTGSAR